MPGPARVRRVADHLRAAHRGDDAVLADRRDGGAGAEGRHRRQLQPGHIRRQQRPDPPLHPGQRTEVGRRRPDEPVLTPAPQHLRRTDGRRAVMGDVEEQRSQVRGRERSERVAATGWHCRPHPTFRVAAHEGHGRAPADVSPADSLGSRTRSGRRSRRPGCAMAAGSSRRKKGELPSGMTLRHKYDRESYRRTDASSVPRRRAVRRRSAVNRSTGGACRATIARCPPP